MFDSPVNDSCPGEITVCGWPWHGRVDYTVSSDSPVLTLPNGVTTTLPWFPTAITAYDWHQHGTLLRFRDPRAPDVERTPEQLAADAERGIEWRADVLYGPREGLVYGIGPTTRQPRSWLYHDGTMNWRSTVFAASQIRLSQVSFVIGRKRQQDVRRNIVVARPSGAPALTDLVVIDAAPDGSRVLLARYRSADIPWGVGSADFVQSELGAWCGMPFDFWELRITHDAETDTYSAGLFSVMGAEDVAGEYEELPPDGVEARLRGDQENVGFDEIYIEGGNIHCVAERSYSLYDVPWRGNVIGSNAFMLRWCRLESAGHRVIGAYYKADGSIGFWSVQYGGMTEITGNPAIALEGPTTLHFQAPSTTPRPYQGEETLQLLTVSNTLSGYNSAWIELLRDGLAVSRAEVRESVTDTHVEHIDFAWSLFIGITSGPELKLRSSRRVERTLGRVLSCTLDGREVFPAGTESYRPVGFEIPPWKNAGVRFFGAPAVGLSSFSAFRYCAQMPVLGVTTSTPDGAVLRQVLGSVSTPDGNLHAGTAERTSPFTGLYGSWNPVTGELLRDIPNPVSYL